MAAKTFRGGAGPVVSISPSGVGGSWFSTGAAFSSWTFSAGTVFSEALGRELLEA